MKINDMRARFKWAAQRQLAPPSFYYLRKHVRFQLKLNVLCDLISLMVILASSMLLIMIDSWVLLTVRRSFQPNSWWRGSTSWSPGNDVTCISDLLTERGGRGNTLCIFTFKPTDVYKWHSKTVVLNFEDCLQLKLVALTSAWRHFVDYPSWCSFFSVLQSQSLLIENLKKR